MNKKIKITILTFLITILTICVGNISYAWSPSTFFPIREGNYTYFCREKGAALRFFNQEIGVVETDSDNEENDLDIDDKDSQTNAVEDAKDNVNKAIQKVKERFDALGGQYRAYIIPGSNYNGDFKDNPTNDYLLNQFESEGEPITFDSTVITDDYFTNEENVKIISGTVKGKYLAGLPNYTETKNVEVIDNITAYIMSAGKNWIPNDYDTRNYIETTSDNATINDQQEALWLHHRDDGGYNIGSRYETNNTALYDEAVEYENFYNSEIKNGYEASVKNDNQIRIIVNKNTGKYTVGPYYAYYPDNGKFSYIEDIYVRDQDGNRINVDVITEDGRAYPGDGKAFFVEFSYATNPSRITTYVDFAYLQTTYAKYKELDAGDTPIYQYSATITVDFYEEFEGYEKMTISTPAGPKEVDDITKPIYSYGADIDYTIFLNQVYMDGNPLYYHAQSGAKLDEASRTWTKTTRDTAGTPIDICMEIGGRVFVDKASGKEGKVDGIYSSNVDVPMSGVKVNLHSKNQGKLIATTTTDANGKYIFKNLNVLDQYYVRFDYNGQYYEPTYYTTPSNTGNYKITSNGTDYANIREKLNVRFASIGSNTSNYDGELGYDSGYVRDKVINSKYNETYTREQLEESKIIDKFGNLILLNSSDSEKQKMIQYVKDCTMFSWTKGINNTIDYYPFSSLIVIKSRYDKMSWELVESKVYVNTGDTSSYTSIEGLIGGAIEDKSQYINQGYKLRQQVDIALKEDIDSATIEINGKKQEYKYNLREASTQDDSKWEIEIRLSDAYYNTQYSRELYPADYQYKVSNYGDYNKYGKTKDDELKVYVTYRLYVKNQSMSIRTKIDEIVHYYDSEYEYVPDRSYIKISTGRNAGTYDVRKSDTSRYASRPGTTTNLDGYQTMYITGLDGIYLDGGQSAEVYLTFIVEKDIKDGEDWIKLDENEQTATPIGVGKESISEINGYSTIYKEGTEIPNVGRTGTNTVAGLIDVDSNPGNLNPTDVPKDGAINYKKFEDDTDKAPNMRLVLYRGEDSARITSGYVWEDERTQINDGQVTATGNGIRENGEKFVNGVTVEFVEVMANGTEYIWRTYENGSGTAKKTTPIINIAGIVKDYEFIGDTTGTYAFKSFVPGNYIVRFKYGDTVKTVLAKNTDATKLLINEYGLSDELKALLNNTSYNGQNYKSTIYQLNLGTYDGKNISKTYNYDIAKGDTALVSDAKDLYNIREKVISYSNGIMNNTLAEKLDSYQNIPLYNGSKYDKDKMKAMLNEFIEKTKMTAETGIINMEVEYNRNMTEGNSVNNTTTYHLANLDFGLEARPKAQIEINKDVKNIKITLANGNVLFDATGSTDNLLWQSNLMYGSSYKNNMMNPDKFTSLSNIRTQRLFGLVQPTMDQELMHGATVRITYEITAKNIGETDYKEEQFYYTGVVKDKNTIATTNAVQVVDYVPNNIQYYEVDNSSYWSVIKPDELISQGLVNSNLKTNIEKFNTIITSKKTDAALVPSIYKEKVDGKKVDSISIPLVLTQLITSENKTKDLTYNNKVELVLQSNIVGRKMEYSVPGNQDPTGEILELDADSMKVSILPPFGVTLTYIIISIITIVGAIIIAGGIIFIKKKVLIK